MASGLLEQTSDVAGVTPAYRRNGKLFSCEPCRRGKLRCDHRTPVCGRCARRNKPAQCFYHPAPLTKQRSSPTAPLRQPLKPDLALTSPADLLSAQDRSPNGLMSPPSSNTPSIPLLDHHSFAALSAAPLPHPSVLQSPLQPPTAPASVYDDRSLVSSVSYTSPESSTMSFRDSKGGFLGPTSYSAVFSENAGSIGVITEADDHSHLAPVAVDKIKQGAEVLSLLRDMPIYREFTQRWFELAEGAVNLQPTFRIWTDELWAEFGSLLQEGKPEELYSLSELVWRNTRKPMNVHGQMTAREWAKAPSGRNLRWEVVGTILNVIGLIAVNLSNWDAIFDSIIEKYVDRITFAERMRKASEFCLCFCYESEVLNDIYISFMFEDLILVSCLKGEAHYTAWQRTGEVCDAIVAMGIHQLTAPDADTPLFLCEIRKRLFASAYGHDKMISTFLGRPPRLSHRYCKIELPLDLADEQLFLEGAELEAALAELDENGWNTNGVQGRATWSRVWLQNMRIREDILEIALGSGDEDVGAQAEQILYKLEQARSSYPDFMRRTPEQVLEECDATFNTTAGRVKKGRLAKQVTAIFTLCVHIGIVHTEFLLQRALVNRKRAEPRAMIPKSRRMLKLVLLAQSRKDFLRDFQGDITGLMALDGLPAAGVIAIELLKQEQTRMHTPDILPRSETIQDLSVFISALATVSPCEGSYSICNQGRKALKKVLDQILSPMQAPTPGSAEAPYDDISLYFPTANDADFLQWLENFEWDRSVNPGPSHEHQ